jgi:hypothetical protein
MKNFTISLYLFQLARAFNDPINQANKDQATLLGSKLKDQLSKKITLEPDLETQLLHDTYFVDLTFSSQDKTMDFLPENISQCNPLLPDQIHNLLDKKDDSIGQTIIIYGVTSEAHQDSANKYVRAFLKDTAYENDNIVAPDQKNLFGMPLFEYFCPITKPTNSQAPDCHILVMLNHQGENILSQLNKHYQTLVDLLCSYYKIKFVYYQQAQNSYQAARQVSQEIEQEVYNFAKYIENKKQNLDQLSAMLDKLPLLTLKHSAYCRELELSLNTIEINQRNYQSYLKKLLIANSQLASWRKFNTQTKDIFLQQIHFWLKYLSPTKETAKQLTDSIRGIVEVEQAKIDRSLERTVQILGVGLGAGGITASAISGHIDQPLEMQGNQIHPGVLSLVVSVAIALIAGLATASWLSLKGKNQQNRQKLLDRGSERSKISQSDSNIKP